MSYNAKMQIIIDVQILFPNSQRVEQKRNQNNFQQSFKKIYIFNFWKSPKNASQKWAITGKGLTSWTWVVSDIVQTQKLIEPFSTRRPIFDPPNQVDM